MPPSVAHWTRRANAYASALLFFALALRVELYLARLSGTRFLFLAFSLAVVAAAWRGGTIPGLLVVFLSALASDYYVLGPGALFDFATRGDLLAFAGFVTGWSVASLLIGRLSRQLELEQIEHADAEEVAAQAHRLSQMTAALGQARTSAAAMEAALQEPLHWLRADAAAFLLIDDDLERAVAARAVGYRVPQDGIEVPLSLQNKSPVSESIRSLGPVMVSSKEAGQAEFPEWFSSGPWQEYETTLVIPIVIDRRVAALVQASFRSKRALSAADKEFISTLSSRAGQTLDRTWRHESSDRARIDAESLRERADSELLERQKTEQALRASETRYRALATRTTRLHALTAGLSQAATVHAVARVIVQQGKAVVGAGAGELCLLADNATQFEKLYAEGYSTGSEELRVAVEPGLGATEAVRGRTPVFIGSFADGQDKFWLSASSAADNGFASMAALPLLVDGAAFGVLTFHFSVPVNFDEEYQALLISVAQHCTQALDRTRLYEATQRARAEAETANRLKDEFVSMVSHELRTPLNAILGWASMLRTGSLDEDVVPRAVDAMYRNASRQAKLVDDLLDFSRIAAGRVTLDLQTIDADTLIRSIVESVVPLAAAKQIELQSSPIPGATIRGDVRRLEQVFTNLLGNALKFTPTGGRVEITARAAERALEIRVKDTGVGILPEFLPFVFDRFRQGDSAVTRSHGGIGLGLAIAKQLVEAHRGTIAAESAGAQQGTTFIVTLPVVGQSVESSLESAAAALPAVRPRLDGIRVLIVDDEHDAREMIAQALKECGAATSVASGADEAFEIATRQEFDVLLSDLAMPDEDGYSLIRRIRTSSNKKLAALPAAAVTARASEDDRRDAIAAGFHVHVAKPIEPFELAQMVDRLAHSTAPAV